MTKRAGPDTEEQTLTSAKRQKAPTDMDTEHVIDEDLHSRQLAVYGRDSMGRMARSNILIIGLKGLGAEVAKNVILAGVKSVTLYDTEKVTLADLSAHFYLSEADIGKPRAAACAKSLQDLNPGVLVHVDSGSDLHSKDFIGRFSAVVALDIPLHKAVPLDALCHSLNIPFIHSAIRGVFASVFCDFGSSFSVQDTDGEEPHQGIIASITVLPPSDALPPRVLITCVEDQRLEFQEGEVVQFSEVEGLVALNDGKPRRVVKATPNSVEVEVEPALLSQQYRRGGIIVQVKQPKPLTFRTLSDALAAPGEFLLMDFSKFENPAQLHVAFQALDQFEQAHGRLPASYSAADAAELVSLAQKINAAAPEASRLSEVSAPLVSSLAHTARGYLNPMAAVFGGIVGQEVVKAVSGKFHPIFQWLYFDAVETLPKEGTVGEADAAPTGSRYDPQIAVFGRALQEKMQGSKVFLVGAGALGCEFLKNLALMGVATGAGEVVVTDDDQIEKSNLSRQFLFRANHIGKAKSACAAEAARAINPSFHVRPLQNRVAPETEAVFNDTFWEGLDVVINALDNVNARLYVDQKCVYYCKPLLESGTLGPKCNTQMVLPHETENYGASRDPPEKSAPMCTLHSFPHNIDHCLVWGRSEFEGALDKAPTEANTFLEAPEKFLSEARNLKDNASKEKLEKAAEVLVDESVSDYDACLSWARGKFDAFFHDKIRDLITSFPEDALTREGMSFWSPPKRFPQVVRFDPADPLHASFVTAAARLKAEVHGIPLPAWGKDAAEVAKRAAGVKPMDMQRGPKAPIDEKTGQPKTDGLDENAVFDDLCHRLENYLKTGDRSKRLNPITFEKDDDGNGHMDLIAGLANLRARCYRIQEVDKLKAKLIAGKIIPAIATATALATGLVCLELYKLLQAKPMDQFRNTFANLALPLFAMAEPIAAKQFKYGDSLKWTLWDRWVIEGDLTLKELLAWFEEKNLSPYSVSAGQALLYQGFMPKHKDRLPTKVAELYTTVAKLSVPEGRKHLDVVVACEDEEGEDVDLPLISLKFKA